MSKEVSLLEHRRLKALLGKVGKLLDEAEFIEPPPELVATPKPVAVSKEQAAVLLGVVPSTLGEYIHSGQLRIFHLGRRVLIRLEALNAFAQGLEDAETIVKAAARND